MEIQQGSIVWARFDDPQGRNPKCRPAVIVTPTNEIVEGGTLVAVAATSTLTDPLPAHHIALPWHPSRHPKTLLRKRCVAICDWLVTIQPSQIENVGGTVPQGVLMAILANLPADPGNANESETGVPKVP